jgi:hypothetical protein
VVVGFDPMSVKPQRIYLCDLTSGEQRTCLSDDLLARIRDAKQKQSADE